MIRGPHAHRILGPVMIQQLYTVKHKFQERAVLVFRGWGGSGVGTVMCQTILLGTDGVCFMWQKSSQDFLRKFDEILESESGFTNIYDRGTAVLQL